MFYAKRITTIICCCISILYADNAINNERNQIMTSTKSELVRPQEPKPPFPYREDEVSFDNSSAGITLSGTLTLPNSNGPFPVVLLISGMGPNDRNATMAGHKRFLVLADYLTRQGLAVLRYDKRGVDKSTGNYATSNTPDFASDAQAAIDYLKTRPDIDPKRIGLLGHSEGGLIAGMIAERSRDIAFVVLMAGFMDTSIERMVEQTVNQLRADGSSEALITHMHSFIRPLFHKLKDEPNRQTAKHEMTQRFEKYWSGLTEELKHESNQFAFAFNTANAQAKIDNYCTVGGFLFSYNPLESLKKITIPVLAVNGTIDWITTPKTLNLIAHALKEAGNKDYITLELQNLNHSLQTCKTGSLMEYSMIEETIAPEALKAMSDWIVKRAF